MFGHQRAEVVSIDDDVQHAGRQHVGDHLGEQQRGQGRRRRRLGDDRVAGNQGRAGLHHHEQHRKIPRHDGTDHAKRCALLDDPLVVGFTDDLGLDLGGGEGAHADDRAHDLAGRLGDGLTLLLGQQTGELVRASLQRIGDRFEFGPAFAEAQRRPGRKCRLGGRHRLVKLSLVGAWASHQHAARRWIEHVKRPGAIDQLPVDQQLVGHHILQKPLVIVRAPRSTSCSARYTHCVILKRNIRLDIASSEDQRHRAPLRADKDVDALKAAVR